MILHEKLLIVFIFAEHERVRYKGQVTDISRYSRQCRLIPSLNKKIFLNTKQTYILPFQTSYVNHIQIMFDDDPFLSCSSIYPSDQLVDELDEKHVVQNQKFSSMEDSSSRYWKIS